MSPLILGLIIGFALIIGIVLHFLVLQMYDSPEGERHLRTRMQGPFVPLSKEDIAEDKARAERINE
jgi:hypothetical protein